MNILLLSWRGPKHPNAGGAEISTHEHAKGWVKAGHRVVLFTSIFKDGRDKEVIDGVEIIRSGRQMLGVQWEVFKWHVFGQHTTFDLVVDQFHGLPFFTPLYVRIKKLAFIHEVTKEVWQLNSWPFPFNNIVAVIGKTLEPLLFILYRKVPFMTVSESTKRDLIQWNIPKNQITVIHNGVRIPKFTTLPPKEKKKTIIYLGAISKDKGIEDAIKIFAMILQKEGNYQFWVAGKYDLGYFNKIQKFAEKLGVHKQIKFFGYVSERNKFKLLSKAHILINPSIREGWGLVVIEAASVGTPTVGYNVTGLRDSVINGKTGILCDINKVSVFEEILKLLRHKNRYEKLRQNCLKWSKQFNWDKSAKESLKLIERLIGD